MVPCLLQKFLASVGSTFRTTTSLVRSLPTSSSTAVPFFGLTSIAIAFQVAFHLASHSALPSSTLISPSTPSMARYPPISFLPLPTASTSSLISLQLSSNNISDSSPSLRKLLLADNELSGAVRGAALVAIDVSCNFINSTFPESSYASNPYLCGTPLPECEAQASISNDSPQENVFARMG